MTAETSAGDAGKKTIAPPKGALPRVAPPLNGGTAVDKSPPIDPLGQFRHAQKELDAIRINAIADVEDIATAMVEHIQATAKKAHEFAAPMIYGALVAVMRDLSAIDKEKRNQAQGYNFRGVDDIYNELHPHLAKHGVICVPEVLDERTEERTTQKGSALIYRVLKIKFTFYAIDGSSVSAVVMGEGMDSGDKASNKAMSVGQKYAFIQVLAIPTKDAKDPENAAPQDDGGIRPREQPQRFGTPPPQAPRAAQPAAAAPPTPPNHPVAQEQKRAAAESATAGNRKLVAVDLANPRHLDWLNGELDRLKVMDVDKREAIGQLMAGKFGNQLAEIVDQYLNPPKDAP